MMEKQKSQNNRSVRKLLASAALATAIISWIATAQGLNLYVFEHYWQAAIISAAIQGTLFAFSVQAIPLMKKLSLKGIIAMVLLWLALLSASSVFSYVYISKEVYSDELLIDDSNRILAAANLKKYMELEDVLDLEKEDIEKDLEEYINLLAGSKSSVSLSDENVERVENKIAELSTYEDEILNSILPELEKVKNENFSVNELNEIVDDIKEACDEKDKQITELQGGIDSLNDQILEDTKRLASFRNTNSSEYMSLNESVEASKTEQKEKQSQKEYLGEIKEKLRECGKVISDIEDSLEKKLYNETLTLRKCMNEEELDIEKIQESAEAVYDVLLENNISASDERLKGYLKFRNDLDNYKTMMLSYEKIEEAIDTVYEYPKAADRISFWKSKLNDIQDIAKDIPDEYYVQYSGDLTKAGIVDLVDSLDRLYLSDLNDFERSWTLLCNREHTYKMLLIFSCVFAFGMDLFSFGSGMLLYFLKDDGAVQ